MEEGTVYPLRELQPVGGTTEERLVEKYGQHVDMYVEYPHKRNWSHEFTTEDFEEGLLNLFSTGDVPVLLYVHMPYCQTQCWFCTCHVEITKKYDDVKEYMRHLYREIDLYRHFFDRHHIVPNFKEIHLGGGSPTFIREPEFDEMVEKLGAIADIKNLDEFAIEIDPRRVRNERLVYYARKGINRISFGVQDFDLAVQKAVNRVQPALLTERLLTPEVRALFPNGVNFDIICGLPHQTVESMQRTMETVVELSPDRVCLNYLDYSPDSSRYHPHQSLMPAHAIPGESLRKLLFVKALDVLEAGGYVRTGYDHFAKPSDDVVRAMYEGKMIWNSLGVTPGRCEDIIGMGVHSYSRLGPRHYAQSMYELSAYVEAVTAGRFPVFRGCKLSQDDIIRRDVIQTLRSYFFIDFHEVEERYGINFKDYFERELASLEEFQQDGIVSRSDSSLTIPQLGHQFANLVCKKFDVYVM